MRADSSFGGDLEVRAEVTLQRHEGPARLRLSQDWEVARASSRGKAEPQSGPMSKVQTVAKQVSQSPPAPHSSHWIALFIGVGRAQPRTSFCIGVRSRSHWVFSSEGGRVWDLCFSYLLSPQSEPCTAPGPQHCRTGKRYASFYAKPRLCRKPFLKPFPTSTHLHRSQICPLPPPH